MNDAILQRIKSLSFDEYWDDIEDTLTNHKPGPSLLIETAFKHLQKSKKDVIAAQCSLVLFQVSAIIMDDIADEDTKGIYLRIGPGRAANLAIWLCNASYRVILESELPDSDKFKAMQIIKEVYDTHAKVIELECKGFDDEKLYWKVVSGKSGQICGNSLKLGAILAEADEPTTSKLFSLGMAMGEIGQVCNDFAGAFKKPANTDWQRSGSNLLLLFAMSKKNPDHHRFTELSNKVFDNEAILKDAQQMLIDCGAASYGGKAITDRLTQMAELSLEIRNDGDIELAAFFAGEIAQAFRWLEKRKISIPDQLLSTCKRLTANH